MQKKHTPPQPIHIPGTSRGEEMAIHKGKEPGRGKGPGYRSARDSTGICAKEREPIIDVMAHIPPA
ncbi:MAG TPA: hypothetical protein VH413_20570 [Verrucomicrobiae bacterium]|jgi:hypothetical protein|nr:hypothetical protein [Verrucomicrobiae bacterium]